MNARAEGESTKVLLHVRGMEETHDVAEKRRADRSMGSEDGGKIGDLQLASQIREICNSVADSAEAVPVLYYGPSTEKKKRQIDRYERAKKYAEKKIEQISDKSVRDSD